MTKSENIIVRASKEEKDLAKSKAKKENRSLSNYIISLIIKDNNQIKS